MHYDPSKQLVLACDASTKGVGCVRSHLIDGVERPIAFYSRTLKPAEKNYSVLDKEALAVICGVKKFHCYLYGRSFIIQCDHKPLRSCYTRRISCHTWLLLVSRDGILNYPHMIIHGNTDLEKICVTL